MDRPLTTTPEETPEVTGRLRVIVADDHPLYRQGIVRALEASGLFDVIGEADDGEEALALIRDETPDVAVLDVRMPGMDGIDVVAALARHGPAIPVVLLSAFAEEALILAGEEAGAAAYLVKTADRDAICRDVAAAALTAPSPRALRGAGNLAPGRRPRWTPRLTSQEYSVLALARSGWDKPELAFLTGVDEVLLRRRLDSILDKLGVDDLGGAVAVAAARGIIRPHEGLRAPGG